MKNLKMFAIALLAMLVMVSGVKAACNDLGVDYGEGEICYTDATFDDIFDDMETAEASKATIIVRNTAGLTLGTSATNFVIPADYDVTLDLNGNDLTVTKALAVAGALKVVNSGSAATITTSGVATIFQVKGGATLDVSGKITLESQETINAANQDAKAIIVVAGGDATSVTVSNDVTVNTKGVGIAVYGDNFNFTSSTPTDNDTLSNVTLNIAGKWTAELYVIQVDGQIETVENAVINVKEGEFTSNSRYAFYASGPAKWNVTGGKIIGKDAFGVRSGDINIGGTAELIGTGTSSTASAGFSSQPNKGAALRLLNDRRKNLVPTNVNITGGSFKAKSNDPQAYAILIDDASRLADSEATKISITNGLFESSAKKAAIYIGGANAEEFLNNHISMISNGQFKNGIVDVQDTKYSEAAATMLAKGSDIKEEGSNFIVGTGYTPNSGTQTPEGQQPGSTEPGDQTTGDGNQGGTDNVPNPNTNDNILVYAGLGLVSLASVAFTAKRKED